MDRLLAPTDKPADRALRRRQQTICGHHSRAPTGRPQALVYVDPVRKWAYLAVAILTEVAGTLALRASQDHAGWLIVVAAGYAIAFAMLTMVLREGVPVGVTYGIWGATGTALTAVLAAIIFGDAFTWPIALGIGLIIAGVLFVEFGSRPTDHAK